MAEFFVGDKHFDLHPRVIASVTMCPFLTGSLTKFSYRRQMTETEVPLYSCVAHRAFTMHKTQLLN